MFLYGPNFLFLYCFYYYLAHSNREEGVYVELIFDVLNYYSVISCLNYTILFEPIEKMESGAGVLFYKIAEYAGLTIIPTMECFSTTIQKKLQGNLSAF